MNLFCFVLKLIIYEHFSNSLIVLIIHQEKSKKITTVTVVWICFPMFARLKVGKIWEVISNTRTCFSPDIQMLRSRLLRGRRRRFLIESSCQYCPSCPALAFLSARNRENRLYVGAILQRHNSIMTVITPSAFRTQYMILSARN